MFRAPATLLLLIAAAAACAEGDDAGDQRSPGFLVGGPDPVPTVVGTLPGGHVDTGSGTPGTSGPAKVVSLDWLGGDATVPPLPAPFAWPVEDAGLRAAIDGALAGREGRYSVIAHNLQDGRYVAIDEDGVYYAASLFKAAVLLNAYQQRDASTADFSEELLVPEEFAEFDLGTLEYLEIEPGDLVTLGDAVKAMIVVSDTVLANVALERLGYNEVDSTLDSIGVETMTVRDTGLPTTAGDMAALLLAIARGEGVSDASRLEMLSLMSQEWFRQGIFAGIPEGTFAAHKTGSFSDATHDVAIVWGPAGPYLLAILTDRSYEWEPIAAVSSAVWQYFESNP